MTLAEQVLHHATKHYNQGGWDILVECWSTKEIEEALGEHWEQMTLEEAINRMAGIVGVVREFENDIRAAGGLEPL